MWRARCRVRLAAEEVTVRTLIPGYPPVLRRWKAAWRSRILNDLFGGEARIVAAKAAGLELFAIDAPHLFGATAILSRAGRS